VVFASPPLINSLSRSLPTPHMLFSLSLGWLHMLYAPPAPSV
jgi:hypothetical protein